MEWFKQVYRWRTGASTVWSILLNIPPLIMFLVISSLMSDRVSLWNCSYLLAYFLSLIIIQLIYSFTSTAKLVIHKTRFQRAWNIICPTHLFVHCMFVVMATVNGMSLLKLAGTSVWTYNNEGEAVLNESYLMSVVYCGYLGLVYSLRYFIDKNYTLVFPVIQQKKIFRLKGHFCSSIKNSLFYCVKYLWSFLFLYCLLGHYFKRIIEIIFVLKQRNHSYWSLLCDFINLYRLLQLISIGVFIHFSWSLGLRLFRVYQTQAVQFPVLPAFANQSDSTLSSALTSSNHLLKHLGFLDLCQLVETSVKRRKQVFSLNQSGSPAVWSDIQRECITLIDKIITDLGGTNLIINDTNSVQSVSLPPTAKEVLHPKGWSQTGQTGLLTRREVFSERARLWSHGSIIETELPKRENAERLNNNKSDFKKTMNELKNKTIIALKKKRIISYFISDLPGAVDKHLFSDSQLLVWSVTAISQLIVTSYTEDTYGVVQQNLQAIVTKLISLSLLLDKKVSHLLTKTQPFDKISAIEINGKYAIKSAAVTGLQLILYTFKDIRFLHLSQEQFDICKRLQIL